MQFIYNEALVYFNRIAQKFLNNYIDKLAEKN